ncbi:unnamed protein product [Absidia cylindrospora]
MTPTFTPLNTSVSSPCSKPDSHIKRPSDTSSIQPSHTWWDESQLDLDLADDSINGGAEEQLNRKQRLKQKLITTMKHTHHQRTSWMSNSSSSSSISSTHSLSTPSISQTPSSHSYLKLPRPFTQLKHLLKKH